MNALNIILVLTLNPNIYIALKRIVTEIEELDWKWDVIMMIYCIYVKVNKEVSRS
jgi:hypothetical protein